MRIVKFSKFESIRKSDIEFSNSEYNATLNIPSRNLKLHCFDIEDWIEVCLCDDDVLTVTDILNEFDIEFEFLR